MTNIINFLTASFLKGVGYNSVNTTRGALSSLGIILDGFPAGRHPLVNRFLKGVFNLRPPRPRYNSTWDVQPVLMKLRSMYPLTNLTLKEITLKLVMLMALTQAARTQTLHLLLLNGMEMSDSSITVPLGDNIKQCRPSFNIQSVTFTAYRTDARLCVCNTLRHYINVTTKLRPNHLNSEKLLISFTKPHHSVTKDTIARWIRTLLAMAGVDTKIFTAGSVRPAAASRAKALAVPISAILARAGWGHESTFARHYDKKIVNTSDTFQEAVLHLDQ